MFLTEEKIQEIRKVIYSDDNKKRIVADRERYMVFNGHLKDAIKKAILKEYILPDTVMEMHQRIVPINIVNKIVTKLARVYVTNPNREPVEEIDQDKEALEMHADVLEINRKMKHANRLFKLLKIVAIEAYPNRYGKPDMRALPSHTFTLFSDDPIDPACMTAFVKHMNWSDDSVDGDRHLIWTDEEQVLIDGGGRILSHDPNDYGVIPFTIIKESDDFLMPIQDDDLISVQYTISLLLTDLSFATKYQAWSLFYVITTGSENAKKFSFNPNSVIEMTMDRDGNKPEIGTIKPTLDSDAMLRQVESLLGMLLTTKSLSIGNVSTKLDQANVTSGVAKLLDQAETTEDRADQIEYFKKGEEYFWYMYAHNILPVWVQAGLISPDYAQTFTEDFKLNIEFAEQKPVLSDKDKIETSKAAIEAGLSSVRREMMRLYPEMNETEIEKLMNEINQEMMMKLPVMDMQDQNQGQDGGKETIN